MTYLRFLVILGLSIGSLLAAQVPAHRPTTAEPPLPVIDHKACPFEGCTFRKWAVTKDVGLYSTWREGRKPVATLKSGQVVTGLTGVHITSEPARVQVLQPLPELRLQAGDTILRYMYRGEDSQTSGRKVNGGENTIAPSLQSGTTQDVFETALQRSLLMGVRIGGYE